MAAQPSEHTRLGAFSMEPKAGRSSRFTNFEAIPYFEDDDIRARLREFVDDAYNGNVSVLNHALGRDDVAGLRQLYRILNGKTRKIPRELLEAMSEKVGLDLQYVLEGTPSKDSRSSRPALRLPVLGMREDFVMDEDAALTMSRRRDLAVFTYDSDMMKGYFPDVTYLFLEPTDDINRSGAYVFNIIPGGTMAGRIRSIPGEGYEVFFPNRHYDPFRVSREEDGTWITDSGAPFSVLGRVLFYLAEAQ